MKPDKILALVKHPGKKIQTHYIENNLNTLQSIVRGWLEAVRINRNTVMLVNENGKLMDLPGNFCIRRGPKGVVITDSDNADDVIKGPAIFLGERNGEWCDLDLFDLADIPEQFRAAEKADREAGVIYG